MTAPPLAPVLSPLGRLRLDEVPGAPPLDPALALRLQTAFHEGAGPGLLQLGAGEVDRALPAAWRWWRDLAVRYVTALCTRAEGEEGHKTLAPPDEEALRTMVASAPPMEGAEYLGAEVMARLWTELDQAVAARLAGGGTVQAPLQELNPAWHVVGRVHFNLAENRRDPDLPGRGRPNGRPASLTRPSPSPGRSRWQPWSCARKSSKKWR